jgi:hypothetical protein
MNFWRSALKTLGLAQDRPVEPPAMGAAEMQYWFYWMVKK